MPEGIKKDKFSQIGLSSEVARFKHVNKCMLHHIGRLVRDSSIKSIDKIMP